jgi:hypothetical protein
VIGGAPTEVLVAALGVLLATLVSLYVFMNNQRRLKFDFMIASWKDWDSIYYAALSNDESLKSLYSMTYGPDRLSLDEMRARAFAHLILNDMFKMWIGSNEGFVSRRSAKVDIKSSLSMLKNSELRAVNLLDGGGYPDEFVDFVKKTFAEVEPFNLTN